MPAPVPRFFDPDWYLAQNRDVAAAGMDAARHFMRFGRTEGRLPCALVSALWAQDLGAGLLEGPEALTPLFDAPSRAEQVWARVCAARFAASNGEWEQTASYLAPLDAQADLIEGFGLLDPVLLMIEARIQTGKLPAAQALWSRARRRFGMQPDLVLMQGNILAATSGAGPAWARLMGRMYLRHGLGGLRLDGLRLDGTGATAFDRLHAKPVRRQRGAKVTVIIPVRDGAKTLDTALRSVRAQSWQTLEILVVDNGSDDGTAQIAADHAARDPRVRVLEGGAEAGAYPARNIGMQAATGDFITTLDADDWAHPARIALQVRALKRTPRAQASISHWARATPKMQITRWWGDAGLVHRNMSSLMIRASVRDRLGFWDRVRVSGDTEYMERLLAHYGPSALVDVKAGLPLSFGRVQAGSLTQAKETSVTSMHAGPRRDYLEAAKRWHRDMLGDLPLPAHPKTRPFAVPDALALTASPAAALEPLAHAPLWNADWVRRTYPDLRRRTEDVQTWFETHGISEGRDPCATFSTSGFMHDHPDADLAQMMAHGGTFLPDISGALPAPDPASGRHLLFVGHQAKPALFGAERSLLDMLDWAIAQGATPSVLLPHLMNDDYATALRARCHKLHIRPFGWRFGALDVPEATVTVLSDLMREARIDAVHVNTSVLDAPLIAARARGLPSTVYVRELGSETHQLCFDMGLNAALLRARVIAQADRVVANAPVVADWLDHPQTLIRPNTFAQALFDLPFAPQTPLRVALIGSLVPHKGLDDMVKLAQLARDLPVAFKLIGPDSPELSALGTLPANIQHTGYVEGAVAAMAQADVVLSLSHAGESFGRSVIEAMAAARPVITYDRGTPPALVGPSGGAGFVVQGGDVAAIVPLLETLIGEPRTLHAMSDAARARAKAQHHTDHNATDRQLFGP